MGVGKARDIALDRKNAHLMLLVGVHGLSLPRHSCCFDLRLKGYMAPHDVARITYLHVININPNPRLFELYDIT
jgi:hypothetical protein